MTIQISEILVWNGEEYAMKSCPSIPENDPRFKVLDDKDFKDTPFVQSTACWRNYFGSWSISNRRLFLDNVEGRYSIVCEKPVFADWYSGTLVIPRGAVIYHSTCQIIHEENVHLEITNGVVTAETIVDNRQIDLKKEAEDDNWILDSTENRIPSKDKEAKKPFWKFW